MAKTKELKRKEAMDRLKKQVFTCELPGFIYALPGGNKWAGRGAHHNAVKHAVWEATALMTALSRLEVRVDDIAAYSQHWELTGEAISSGRELVTYLLFEGPFTDFVGFFNQQLAELGVSHKLIVAAQRDRQHWREDFFKTIKVGKVPDYPGLGLWRQIDDKVRAAIYC